MRYHDFDLWIEKGAAGTIALRSRCDVHGEYTDSATLDPATLERDEKLLADEQVERSALIDLGTRLYAYTFATQGRSIEWHFGQCWGAAGNNANGVRVRLRVEAPELAVIPWEYIYSQRLRCFLGVSERTPIVRYLELPQAIGSLEVSLPVRMLVAIPGQSGLDTEQEKRELLETLQPLRDVVRITTLDGEVTRERIVQTLGGEERFHLFHFIGHGGFDGDRAVLVLNRSGGGQDLVDHERVASLFRNHPSMKLVVLNSCRGAQLSASKPFVGMAAELVKVGIPAVIAMQYEILDREAICFAGTLYRELFLSADRGRIEIAISHARNALADEFPNTNAVGLPVLFMHAREGVLFNLVTGRTIRDLPLSARAAERTKAVIRTHARNLAILAEQAPQLSDAPETITTPAVERQALDRATRLLRLRNASIVLTVAIALILCLAAAFFGFRAVSPVFRPESYVVAFSDLLDRHGEPTSLTVVTIDSATTKALGGPHDSTWRGRHAVVVDRLQHAGARVLAFNLSFGERPSQQMRALNDSLARALHDAHDQGTTVVVAIDSFVRGQADVQESFAPYVVGGTTCVGSALFTTKVLTVDIASANAGKPPRIHSLPLEAVAAFQGTPFNDEAPVRDALAGRGSTRSASAVVLDSVLAGGSNSACRAVQQGDTLYRMVIDFSPRHELRNGPNRLSYLDVLRGAPLGDLSQRLVLIGVENPQHTFDILLGLSHQERSAFDLEADAMNTLLRGVRIAPLQQGWQFLTILTMGALGALAASAVVTFGRLSGALSLALAIVVYFLFGAVLYARDHALLNTFFDLSALFLTFVAVTVARRVWFP
jgi:CHASE2 domain-containing sensor protein